LFPGAIQNIMISFEVKNYSNLTCCVACQN